MSALSLAAFANPTALQQPALPAPRSVNSVEAFQDALSRQQLTPSTSVEPPMPPVPGPEAIRSDNGLDASTVERERVRKSLGLDGTNDATVTTGDTILGGIQKLRGVFGEHTAHIGDLMKSNMATTQGLMAMQMEVAQYTVMVDVSSKLMGKASSSLDTLMKGQ